MCGICGYITKRSLKDSVLTEMRDTITYRGPDDAGNWYGDHGIFHIGMAHRRLSIMDLSEYGHQPMCSPDGRYVLVFNGEIYNFVELREELREKGYTFVSDCDTEVFLNAFAYWKEDSLNRINGMFAFAIWDNTESKLVLGRDRIGKKPVYYYHNRSTGDFVFGSELKPIIKFPYYEKRIRQESIGDFFCNKYIAAPNTIFENTYKLVPGTYITFTLNEVISHKYWDLLEANENKSTGLILDYESAKGELESIIRDSVRRRMIADVPVGTFLSGGIDSSLITALACQEVNETVKTYSIGFYEKNKDEAPYAKEIAKYLGTDHTEFYVSNDELFDLVGHLSECYDEPFSDSSQIPSMAVSKLASKSVKVVLTGDGGDELFCGYKMYDWLYWVQRMDVFGGLAYLIPFMRQGRIIPSEVRAFINNRSMERKTQLFTSVRHEEADKIVIGGIDLKKSLYDHETLINETNLQKRRMLLDMMTYLPDEILCKMDRASMYSSLEVRCPLLDHRVIEGSFRIPHKYMYYRKDKKHILKDITYKHIPKELLDRPKKGFSSPINEWLRDNLSKKIEDYSEQTILEKQGIFRAKEVHELIVTQKKSNKVSHNTVLWSFFVFQNWYQRYVEDLW